MPVMITTTVELAKWPTDAPGPFTTQAQLDQCAEELFSTQGIASETVRRTDQYDTDERRLQIHAPSSQGLVVVSLGQIAIQFNGKLEALTPDEFAARGFSESS